MNDRDFQIIKLAFKHGYEFGHNDTVESSYNPPENYDYDKLEEMISDGIFSEVVEEKEICCLISQHSSQMVPQVIFNSFSETTCKKYIIKTNDGCAFIKTSIAIKDSRSPTGWLVPGNIKEPTTEDLQLDAAIKKAKESGLTNDVISILMKGLK